MCEDKVYNIRIQDLENDDFSIAEGDVRDEYNVDYSDEMLPPEGHYKLITSTSKYFMWKYSKGYEKSLPRI